MKFFNFMTFQVFHDLQKACVKSLLTSFTGFDSSVDQTLTTSHGMEIELCWCQSSKVGILHKSSTLGTIVIFNKVRKGTVTETKWNPFTFHVLLTYNSNNLQKKQWKRWRQRPIQVDLTDRGGRDKQSC